MIPSLFASQVNESRKRNGHKKIRKSAFFRALKKTEAEVRQQKARAERSEKRLQRINKSKTNPSPRKKVDRLLKNSPKCVIKRKLLFGEAILVNLKINQKSAFQRKIKKILTNIISGKILRKYKLLQEAKQFLSQRQLSHFGKIREQRKSKAILLKVKELITKFLLEETNSNFTPGKRDFITKQSTHAKKNSTRFTKKSAQKI